MPLNESQDLTTNVVCSHLDMIEPVTPRTPEGCEDCLRTGSRWVHLRMCLTCGHVGCCDSSPSRHARSHAHDEEHPLVQSYEPGEDWRYCFVDDEIVGHGPLLRGDG